MYITNTERLCITIQLIQIEKKIIKGHKDHQNSKNVKKILGIFPSWLILECHLYPIKLKY